MQQAADKTASKTNRASFFNWPLALLLLVLFVSYGFLATRVGTGTYDGGPDEYIRILVPKAIASGNLLPRGDDPATIGSVGGYSYAYYPQMLGPYVQALFMVIARLFGATSEAAQLIAARFCSVCFGVFGAWLAGQTVKVLVGERDAGGAGLVGMHFAATGGQANNKPFRPALAPERWALLATALVGFWPQYAFLAAYVNNDIIAIAGVGLLLYALVCGTKRGWTFRRGLVFAAGIIVCALSYMNTYGYILVGVPFFIVSVWRQYRGGDPTDKQEALRIILSAAALCAICCLPFFIVCLVRYGDPFGNSAFAAAHAAWVQETLTETMQPYQGSFWQMLTDADFFNLLYKSYVAYFAYMAIPAPAPYCAAMLGATILLALVGAITVLCAEHKRDKALLAIMFAAGLITIFLMYWRSYTTDAQPQGRYILPTLIPLCVASVLGLRAIIGRLNLRTQQTIIALCIFLLAGFCFYLFADTITTYAWLGPTHANFEGALTH